MELPSKELLSAVLGECCKESRRVENNNLIYFCSLDWDEGSINIHELMHMMKEWLTKQSYIFTIYHHLDTVAISVARTGDSGYISPSMSVRTEFEAVTEACEWKLNQKENNGKA